MKRALKIVGILVGVILLIVAGIVAKFAMSWRPMYGEHAKPELAASKDPAVIARGKYLVEAVAHCGACHSVAADYKAWKPGDTLTYSGGYEWKMGPIGTIRSVNISSDPTHGIANYTDAELARAIRYGVAKDGRGLFFMMGIGPMSDEDLVAIMSYIRTLPPVAKANVPSEVGLMGKILFQSAMGFLMRPHDYSPLAQTFVPEGGASVERGRYLALGPAMCGLCHSNFDFTTGSTPTLIGTAGAGSSEPYPDDTDPAFEIAAPNLTPDPRTGHLKGWTQEQFVERFRKDRVYAGSPMPWESFRALSDEDLQSIWLWTQSLTPTDRMIGPPRREVGWKAE